MKILSKLFILLTLSSLCVAQQHHVIGRGTGHTKFGHTSVPVLLITPSPPFTITSGTQGQAYAGYTFQAQGGVPPYLWDVSSTPGLPGGLTLNQTSGAISGTPSVNGTFIFTAHVTDSSSQEAFGTITITINPPLANTVVAPTKPQNWVNTHECDPPNGTYDETKYLGTGANSCPANPSAGACDYIGTAGLQASMDDWAAQTTDKWRHVIVTHGIDLAAAGTVGGQQSGVLLFKSKVIGSRITNRCIVYESDSPNVADQTVGSHGVQDLLPQSTNPGLRNPGLDGGCVGGYYIGVAGACVGGTNDSSFNDKANLWTITATSASGAALFKGPLVAGFGANHIMIRDAEIHHTPGFVAPNASIISIDMNGTENTVNALASHVFLDRSWIHEDVPDTGPTDTTFNAPNGAKWNCNYCAITNSYFDGLLRPGGEGHIVVVTDSTGPVEFLGNWAEGESSSFFIGGAPPAIPGIVSATDLVMRQNHLGYPRSWRGLAGNAQGGMVRKNGLETKECVRCLLAGNIIEEVDATGGQKGNLLVTTVRSCSGGDCDNYQSTIEDYTIENNIFRHGCQGSQGDGRSGVAGSGNSVSEGGKRWRYFNNLWYDIQRTNVGCFETGMNAGTNQGQKFQAGGSIWTNCTAGKAPNGRDAFVDCTASPDNTLGQHQTNMRVGDLAQIINCSNTSFNSGISTDQGVVTLSPTIPTNLVVYYTPKIQPTTQTTTLCQLSNYQGFPRDVEVSHSTVIINYNGTENGSPFDSGSTSTKPTFSQRFRFKNNIGIGGGFGHTSLEGTPTETTQWDATLLEFCCNVFPARTASKYSEYLTFGATAVSPPVKSFFPTTNNCTGAPTASCLGMVGNSSAGSFDHNLADWHDYRLCHANDPDSRCVGTASNFAAGRPGQADDGKDMGFDPVLIDAAMTEGQYSGCNGDCGPTGPFADKLPIVDVPVADIQPNNISFGDIVVPNTSASQNITVRNSGGDILTISSVTKSGTNQAEFNVNNSCPASIQPSGQCTIATSFHPTTIANNKIASVTIVTNDTTAPSQAVTLSGNGTGTAPAISLTPNSIAYGTVNTTNSVTQPVTLKNTGGQNLTVSGLSFSGANTNNFSVATLPNPCTVVLPNGTCTLNVTFTPLSPSGAKTATLTVASNSQSGGNTVTLTGTAAITGGGTVTAVPNTDTIPQAAKLVLQCKVVGGGTCTYAMVSGLGSITSGIYTAPGSNTTAVYRATNGSNSDTGTITVTGTLPTFTGVTSFPSGTANCSTGGYTLKGKGTMNVCKFTHAGIAGNQVRRFGVVLPSIAGGSAGDFVPGQSALIFVVGDGGHGLGNPTTTGECAPPGSETGGIGVFVHTIPTPAPGLICMEGPYGTNPACSGATCEFWDSVVTPYSNITWTCTPVVTPCTPDSIDSTRLIAFTVMNQLSPDLRQIHITGDWTPLPGLEGETYAQLGAQNADIFASAALWNDSSTTNLSGASVSSWHSNVGAFPGKLLPPMKQPMSVISLFGVNRSTVAFMIMCGNNTATTSAANHPLNVDDQQDYYDAGNGITQHTTIDPSGSNTKFCKVPRTYTSGVGDPTTLEYKLGTNGDLGTETAFYKLLGMNTGTPLCSFGYAGTNVLGCGTGSGGGGPAMDFRRPPNGPATCNSTNPCTSGLNPGTGQASVSSYHRLGMFYSFMIRHPKQ